MNFENDEQLERLRERIARVTQAKHDYHNEIGGRDVGRIARFTSAQGRDGEEVRDKRSRRDAQLTRLQMLMADPAYAALYKETRESLREAQSKLDTLLERAQAARLAAQAALEDTLAHAARLEDGQLVFRDESGAVRLEDSSTVDDVTADSVVWRGDEPSWEDFNTARERADTLENTVRIIREGQAEIGTMQDRMADPDDPLSADELRRAQERAKEISAHAEEQLSNEITRSSPTSEMKVDSAASVTSLTFPDR